MSKGKFEGWYFKHQLERNTIAFIPGNAASGAFVQMLAPSCTRYFSVPKLLLDGDRILAGRCVFSPAGCKIDLPEVRGEIAYDILTPLQSDIMGPFRFLPMKCRHGVISMTHTLRGCLTVEDTTYCFDGGKGYIEKDSGISFPRSYQWLQCNDFGEPCSLMLSIAHIPFFTGSFIGCICAVLYRGREYRLATYKGVRITAADDDRICLSQGNLQLNVEMLHTNAGHYLKAPVDGRMTDMIRECVNAKIRVTMSEGGRLLFDLCSPYAAYEAVADAEKPLFRSTADR